VSPHSPRALRLLQSALTASEAQTHELRRALSDARDGHGYGYRLGRVAESAYDVARMVSIVRPLRMRVESWCVACLRDDEADDDRR
jgi:hypothetical protein